MPYSLRSPGAYYTMHRYPSQVYLAIICALSSIAMTGLLGMIWLAGNALRVPQSLAMLVGMATGALSSLLVQPQSNGKGPNGVGPLHHPEKHP